jgi:small subunit ribosomal protein S6
MRHYEAMYIVDPDVADESLDPVIERFRKIVSDGGGEVTEAGKWEKGRRPLAYEIAKKREGTYILMQFQSDTAVPKELDRIFRISDEVIRHLIVRQDEDEE